MSEATLNLLLQIPLAGIVVVVVVLFLRHLDANTARMMHFIEEQETSNRAFLREQRDASNEAIGRLAEEIKATRQDVRELRGLVVGVAHERVRVHE